MRAALVDISRYQGNIDAAKIKATGFCSIIARCTIGTTGLDASAIGKGLDFYRAAQQKARDQGLIFGAYHVLWPSNKAPAREADNFLAHCGDIDLAVVDVELSGGLALRAVQDQTFTWLQYVEARLSKKLFVYTASWFWTAKHGTTEARYPLWEAEYLLSQPRGGIQRSQQPEPPKAPASLSPGWSKWLMWQWTSGGNPLGAQSESMDYNVWNGDEASLRQYLGLLPPAPGLDERVGKLETEARAHGWAI